MYSTTVQSRQSKNWRDQRHKRVHFQWNPCPSEKCDKSFSIFVGLAASHQILRLCKNCLFTTKNQNKTLKRGLSLSEYTNTTMWHHHVTPPWRLYSATITPPRRHHDATMPPPGHLNSATITPPRRHYAATRTPLQRHHNATMTPLCRHHGGMVASWWRWYMQLSPF